MSHPAYKRYWISYDIASDHLRQNVSQLLTGWGVRVQYSAFECVLNPTETRRLQKQLLRMVKPEDGQIVILQCAVPGRPGHPLLGRPHDHQYNYWIG